MPKLKMMEEKDWILKIIDERDKRYEQRFDAQEKAVVKSETASEKRFDSVNEFRGQLKDQAATLIPRSEVQILFDTLSQKINALEAFKDKTIGGSLQNDKSKDKSQWVIGTIIGAVGILIGLLFKILD